MARDTFDSATIRRALPDPCVVAYSLDRDREYVIRLRPPGFIAVAAATKANGAEDLHIIDWLDEPPPDSEYVERLRQEAIEVLDAYLTEDIAESPASP
jgi:hypothetical protein